MDKKRPPEWLINFPTVEDFNFSKNINDWIYRGQFKSDFYRKLECNKCGKVIQIITVNSDDPHGIGNCNKCGKVHWLEIKK